jgi:hypothetical protein
MALVPVEHGERKIVDVGRDAEAKNEHQEGRTEEREAEPDRIAQEFQRFADRAGEKSLNTEHGLRCLGVRSPAGLQRRFR